MGERRSHDEPYKRFACDRCHALKLRCMRKDGPDAEGESCVRCHRASALCRYSPSERLGRPPDKSRLKPPSNPRIPSQKRRRCEANVAMEWVATAPSGLNRLIPGTSLWNEQSTHAARWTAKDDPDDTIEFSSNLPPSQEIRGSPLIDTRPHPSGLGSTGESNQDMFSCDNGRDLFESSTRGSSADFDLDDPSLEFLAADCFADTVQGDDGTNSQDYSLGMPTIFHETSIVLDKGSADVPQDPASSKQSQQSLMANANESYVETTQPFRPTSSDVKEKSMRQLSDIIIALFQQLKTISPSSSVKVSSPFPEAAPEDSPAAYHLGNKISIGDVFRISEELIRILETFEPISGRSARPSPAAASRSPSVGVLPFSPPNARPISPVSLSSHDSRSLRERNDSKSRSPCFSPPQPMFSPIPSISPARSVRYSNETARNESSLGPNSCFPTEPHPSPNMRPSAVPLSHFKFSKLLQLDIPTMLLIVTCYNLLTRIYNVFFTRWLRILTRYPSAADRELLPEILPCFELGGFKPPNYGSLQMSIIIEASMHLIRKIEEYLERPDRKQEGGTGPKGPVLQLMDLVMEDGESPVQLRENVEAIKQLIKS
ncbi:hypothetical protein MMC31_000961 [Peltigera leucophlebia]|nr:hypothetical protein [Peltigera leucophlebia]